MHPRVAAASSRGQFIPHEWFGALIQSDRDRHITMSFHSWITVDSPLWQKARAVAEHEQLFWVLQAVARLLLTLTETLVASETVRLGLTHSIGRLASAGFHHVLQAQHVQVHSAALGPDARLLHRLRHRHAENVQVRPYINV